MLRHFQGQLNSLGILIKAPERQPLSWTLKLVAIWRGNKEKKIKHNTACWALESRVTDPNFFFPYSAMI